MICRMPGEPERVLVVDDEAAVRELVEALLRRIGHRVETAALGAEALSKVQSSEFDLVITDLVMPGMAGDQLAREIKKLRPELPVVLLTGHHTASIGPEISLVLNKPFTLADIRHAIEALT